MLALIIGIVFWAIALTFAWWAVVGICYLLMTYENARWIAVGGVLVIIYLLVS